MNISRGPGGRSLPLLRKAETSAAGTASRTRPSLPGAGATSRAGISTTQDVSTARFSSHASLLFGSVKGGTEHRAADTAADRRVCIRFPPGEAEAYGHGCGLRLACPLREVCRTRSGAPKQPRDSSRGEVGSPAMQMSFGTDATRTAGHVAAFGLQREATVGLVERVGLKHSDRLPLEGIDRSIDAGCRGGRSSVARPPRGCTGEDVPLRENGVDGASGRYE